MKKRLIKSIITIVLLIVFISTPVFSGVTQNQTTIVQAATVKISAKKLNLTVGQSKKLKITGTKAKVKWSTSKKAIATVNSKGKVTAKKAGSTNIIAKVQKKTFKCKVTVKKKKVVKPNIEVVLKDNGVYSDSNTSYIEFYIKNNDTKPIYVSDSVIVNHVSSYLNSGRLVNIDTTTIMECNEDGIIDAEYIQNTYDEDEGNYIKFTTGISGFAVYTNNGIYNLDILKSTIQFFVVKDNIRFTYLYNVLNDKVQVLNQVNDYYITK